MSALHHVEIYVSDLARTKDFYDWLLPKLGYALYQQWAQGASYIAGDCYLVFVQTKPQYLTSAYHRCHTGLNHLAFYAPDQQAVDALRAELLARQVPVLYDDRYPFAGGEGHYAVYFEDPDRIKLEVVAQEETYGDT